MNSCSSITNKPTNEFDRVNKFDLGFEALYDGVGQG